MGIKKAERYIEHPYIHHTVSERKYYRISWSLNVPSCSCSLFSSARGHLHLEFVFLKHVRFYFVCFITFLIIRIILNTFVLLPLIFFLTFCYALWDMFYGDTNSHHSLIFTAIWHYMTGSQIIYSPVDGYLHLKVSCRYKIPSSGNHVYLHTTLRNNAVNSFCVDSSWTCDCCSRFYTQKWDYWARDVHLTLFQVSNCSCKTVPSYTPITRVFQLLHVYVNT